MFPASVKSEAASEKASVGSQSDNKGSKLDVDSQAADKK